jgi:hypothetical protein
MAALGILIAYIIYGLIALTGLFFGWKIFTSKTTWRKILFIIGCLSCFTLLTFITFRNKQDNKEASLQFVGTYNLIKYPNCDSCKAILDSDNSFVVVSYKTNDKDTILEKGSWHYVAEGDFLGVYMDKNENELLGSGRFDYSYYIDSHNKFIEAPKIGP